MLIKKITCLVLALCVSLLYAQEKEFTFINTDLEKIFSVKAKYVGSFSDGMVEVRKTVLENNAPVLRSGFLNEKGEQVIPAIYDKVRPFAYGVAWVKEAGVETYYLINKKGERLGDGAWKKPGYFFEGFCSVINEQGKTGFVNRKGELIIPCNFIAGFFSEGKVCIMPFDAKEEKYGFMDTTGKLVIPYKFKQAGTTSFVNGEARVMINGVTCLINHKGEVVFKPELTKNCMGFSNGLSASYASSNRGDWGFYNRKHEWIIKPQYDHATSFTNGIAIVLKRGKYGVIDTTGKMIIPFIYESIFGSPGETGYYGVEKVLNQTKEYLNDKGLPFTSFPIKFLLSANKHALLPYCDVDNKYGFLNLDGTILLTAQFEKTESFSEGKTWISGDASKLKIATDVPETAFVKEYVVGEKVKARKKGKGDFFPGSIRELSEYYYLVMFENGEQEWVTYDNLHR